MSTAEIDYYSHPVFHSERLRLDTRQLGRLRSKLVEWLWTGATGGVILGPVRVGKTTAMIWLADELSGRDGVPIPCYYLSVPPRDRRTVLSVFRQLCGAVGLRASNHDRADHLSDRFVHYLSDQAKARGCDHAVLIADEMQRLTPLQFGAFAEIHDRLRLLGVLLTVFFVGNAQECGDLIDTIKDPQHAHIYGRFFTHKTTFVGLTTKREVQHCLAQYDRLRYPEDGPTYTGYFLPEAVGNGWRLASLAGALWEVFGEYRRDYHIRSWGMQYFTAAVNSLLVDFLPAHGVEAFDHDMVHECIRISGLVPDLVRTT